MKQNSLFTVWIPSLSLRFPALYRSDITWCNLPEMNQQPERWGRTAWQWYRSTAPAPGRWPASPRSHQSTASQRNQTARLVRTQDSYCNMTIVNKDYRLYMIAEKRGTYLTKVVTDTYFTLLLDQPGAFPETMLLQWTVKTKKHGVCFFTTINSCDSIKSNVQSYISECSAAWCMKIPTCKFDLVTWKMKGH